MFILNDSFAHVSKVGPPTLSDQSQTCTNILQILCNYLQIYFQNLQTSTYAVGIVSKLGGGPSRSLPTSSDRSRTGANILQIVCNNLQTHFQNLQITRCSKISILKLGWQPYLRTVRWQSENDIYDWICLNICNDLPT